MEISSIQLFAHQNHYFFLGSSKLHLSTVIVENYSFCVWPAQKQKEKGKKVDDDNIGALAKNYEQVSAH